MFSFLLAFELFAAIALAAAIATNATTAMAIQTPRIPLVVRLI
jgi:hypothetical protein